MELSPICKKEYPALRALYHSAFPAAERMPLSRFFALQKKGQAEILVLRTGGAFAGLMIVTFAPGYALLNYFAVEPDCRSMGLGSRALPALQQRYPNRQVVLEVEPPDHTAPNARQRQRRLDFYAKNGFLPCNLPVRLCGVHWMCSPLAGRHWILPPIKGFITRSLAVWRPFLCKSANKTPPGQILLVFWPGVV